MTNQTDESKPKTESDIKEEAASPAQKNTLKIVLIVVGVLVVLSILGAAILAWIGGSIGKTIIEQATDSSISTSDNGITIETDEGEFSMNADQELSRDFPSEVPIFTPSSVAASSRLQQEEGLFWTASLSTNSSIQEIESFYEDALARDGWTTESAFETGGMSNFGASNESAGLEIQVSIIADQLDDENGITLTVIQREE